jgi:hypothetical protein
MRRAFFFASSALALALAALACGSSSSPSPSDSDGGTTSSSSSSTSSGGSSCQDLAAKSTGLIEKQCLTDSECAITTKYECCVVYFGIRKDNKAAYEAAYTDYQKSCPDNRGCQCQDHAEADAGAPAPSADKVTVSCDFGKCTAHAVP